ncbi:hypothetical protein ACFPPF_17685 [Xenophilus aerolatus]|nr:hypothetical protein [Xenophilus aerolatus]
MTATTGQAAGPSTHARSATAERKISPFDAWKDGIDKADADWDVHDCEGPVCR